jgi:hypothetical protein
MSLTRRWLSLHEIGRLPPKPQHNGSTVACYLSRSEVSKLNAADVTVHRIEGERRRCFGRRERPEGFAARGN